MALTTWAATHGCTLPLPSTTPYPGLVLARENGNLSTSLKNLAVKGLVTITRTTGGKAEAVDLTRRKRNRAAALTASCQ
jgi:hypothetical protein